jgi:hypothetical protein
LAAGVATGGASVGGAGATTAGAGGASFTTSGVRGGGAATGAGDIATSGGRELRTNTSVTTTAFTPRTAISAHTHQRGRVTKNGGRRTTRGTATPFAFSSSARLSAS